MLVLVIPDTLEIDMIFWGPEIVRNPGPGPQSVLCYAPECPKKAKRCEDDKLVYQKMARSACNNAEKPQS